eukprot:gene23014-27843_t
MYRSMPQQEAFLALPPQLAGSSLHCGSSNVARTPCSTSRLRGGAFIKRTAVSSAAFMRSPCSRNWTRHLKAGPLGKPKQSLRIIPNSQPCDDRFKKTTQASSSELSDSGIVEAAKPGIDLQRASTASRWVTDLTYLFLWDRIVSELGAIPEEDAVPLRKKAILLDGANLAWAYGSAVAKRFKCRTVPQSEGVLLALNHPAWQEAGFAVTAVIPHSYVIGPYQGLVDGGAKAAVNLDKVKPLGKGTWRNEALWKEVEAGRLRLVKRPATTA